MDRHQSPRPLSTIRRNPPRKAKQTPAANAPDSSTSSSSFNAVTITTGITPFSLEEILEADRKTEPEPLPKPQKKPANESENLKVFLRVRPLEIRPKPVKNPKAKPRGNPQAPSTKGGKCRSNKESLVVNDPNSVTLSAPPSVFDSKRSKSEIYDGFSFVFPPESPQEEIYDRVMNPLLMDFMRGKSGLLAAMGPTGSGKTHTMFGSPREPGVVPLALRHIFNHSMESAGHHLSRSYYLSMFEIYSERGKGERIFDLSSDGGDLSFQQSAIKGLQEIRISDATEAESLVAHGLLKRATAATSANNQSSRSQCIINIRCTLENLSDKNDLHAHNTVLTIADLAGAERERKTGNQGARLLESNFINNTSMVFALCLRSLLEYQKNPKKPFEKHFKNSLLTRYLRDYLEGKKHMTLILTVKPGEDDYLETSFLLRQASPYMKIKYNIVEDAQNVPRQKRNTTLLFQTEEHKRRKIDDSIEVVRHGKSDGDIPGECQISEKEVYSEKFQDIEVQHILNMSSESIKKLHNDEKLNKEFQLELARMKRNDEVMRKFSKALWSVLKQYKNKLEESEDEVRSLKETLAKEINQVVEMKNELKELRSCCSCYKHLYTEEKPIAKADGPFTHPANALSVSSSNSLDVKNTDTDLTNDITPMISAYEAVCSSFPSGRLERQNDQTPESLPELEHVLEYSEHPSNLCVNSPSDLSKAEMSCGNVTSSSKLIYRTEDFSLCRNDSLSKDDKKNIQDESKGSPGQGHCSKNLVQFGNLRVMEIHCSKSSTGMNFVEEISHSDVMVVPDQVEGSTSVLYSSDECSTLVAEKVEASDTACSMLSVEDTKNLNNENGENLHECRHKPEGVKDGKKESSCNASLTGMNFVEETSHSDVVVVPDKVEVISSVLSTSDGCSTLLVEKVEAFDPACSMVSEEDTRNLNTEVEDNTSVWPSSDECSPLLVAKVEASDTACSMLRVEGTHNLNNELLYQKGRNLHECKHKPEDVENESSHNASLTETHSHSLCHPSNAHELEEDERGIVHKKQSNIQEIKPDVGVSLVIDVKEKENCLVRETPNIKHSSSTNFVNAEKLKQKRRLLPASALLLKEFNGLDMEAENAKEVRSKLTAVGRGRSQGSNSLVRLLIGKQ